MSNERLISGDLPRKIFMERYLIKANKMAFYAVHEGVKEQLSEFFTLNMQFERMKYAIDFQTIFDDCRFDTTYQIKGSFSPIILALNKTNFLVMLSNIFSNLSYDDMKDSHYVFNYQTNV
mmetsp:Transcript_23555/g.20460  ORF Transcript_23555/g.20460 Transcript_23555/m.20460 type:complete len:120 (-) Transcript_23555:120-479(-)